jgi:antitoxin component YwqK of YwqJK toxin-antitoxin module
MRKPEENPKIEAWFADAQQMLKHYVEMGQTAGRYSIFYSSGRRLLEGEWQNGRPHGPTLTWYPNGNQMHEVGFCEGAFHGSWRKWDKGGELLVSAKYEHGILLEWIDWIESRKPGLIASSY